MSNVIKKGPKFIKGDPWTYCEICNIKFRVSETRFLEDGRRVCEADWTRDPRLKHRPRYPNEDKPMYRTKDRGEEKFRDPTEHPDPDSL